MTPPAAYSVSSLGSSTIVLPTTIDDVALPTSNLHRHLLRFGIRSRIARREPPVQQTPHPKPHRTSDRHDARTQNQDSDYRASDRPRPPELPPSSPNVMSRSVSLRLALERQHTKYDWGGTPTATTRAPHWASHYRSHRQGNASTISRRPRQTTPARHHPSLYLVHYSYPQSHSHTRISPAAHRPRPAQPVHR